MWQAGADMTGDGKTRAEWNISLMQDIISPCYVRLLLRLKAILGFSCVYQHKWPSTTVMLVAAKLCHDAYCFADVK